MSHRPRVAVVTTIGSDHRAAFRTLEGTAAEKQKLVAAVPADGVLNVLVGADLAHAASAEPEVALLWWGRLEKGQQYCYAISMEKIPTEF